MSSRRQLAAGEAQPIRKDPARTFAADRAVRPDERVMVGKHLRVDAFPQSPKQRRRALNVGKEKGESLHGHSVEGPAKPPRLAPSAPTGQHPLTRPTPALDGSPITSTILFQRSRFRPQNGELGPDS